MKKAFRYLITVYALSFGLISVIVSLEVLNLLWPFILAPLLSIGLFALSYALRETGIQEGFFSSYFNLFRPSLYFLPKEMIGRLKDTVERPLYYLWRTGMVVPLCFAPAFWIIFHIMFGGDEINTRSWCVLACGGGIAVLSLLLSRRLGLRWKCLWVGLTLMAYPLLFAVVMLIGLFLDVFHFCWMAER